MRRYHVAVYFEGCGCTNEILFCIQAATEEEAHEEAWKIGTKIELDSILLDGSDICPLCGNKAYCVNVSIEELD